jgi:hypothetical protein
VSSQRSEQINPKTKAPVLKSPILFARADDVIGERYSPGAPCLARCGKSCLSHQIFLEAKGNSISVLADIRPQSRRFYKKGSTCDREIKAKEKYMG